MAYVPRAELLRRLHAKRESGRAIIGAGAGTGLSAKCEEEGGADLIVVYNSGRFRMAGRGSLSGLLAYGNANDLVVEMGREILPMPRWSPVLAGVNGTDPFLDTPRFLQRLRDQGFSGVQNFPTVGLIDGTFRANLEETGMGYSLEVDMIRTAAELDIFSTPYVFSADDADAMAEAGADVVVVHLGLTTGGSVGAETARDLEDSIVRARECTRAAREVRPDILVLVHGGPVAEPADAKEMLQRIPELDGFYGASSMERLPVERALTAKVAEFAALRLPTTGSAPAPGV